MQFLRYHAINNLHGLYWKQTKNFADPAVTAHVKDSTFEGLHSRIGHGAVGTVSYARVEHCGQLGVAGKYCLHFHMSQACRDCVFRGNAIEHGSQRGIIVHGTHRSVVEDNVLYDLKGSYIYVEDGNEMENLFKNNVALCPVQGGCKTSSMSTDNDQADNIQQVSSTCSRAGREAED